MGAFLELQTLPRENVNEALNESCHLKLLLLVVRMARPDLFLFLGVPI